MSTLRCRVFYIADHLLGRAYFNYIPRAGDYRYVTTIMAENPEDAFAKMNRGSGAEVPQLEGQRSLSVGDVIYMEDVYYLCMPAGWEPLGPGEKMSELYRAAVAAERP